MSVLGIGVDLVEQKKSIHIEHSNERFYDRFLNRVYLQTGEVRIFEIDEASGPGIRRAFRCEQLLVSKAVTPALAKQIPAWRDIR